MIFLRFQCFLTIQFFPLESKRFFFSFGILYDEESAEKEKAYLVVSEVKYTSSDLIFEL